MNEKVFIIIMYAVCIEWVSREFLWKQRPFITPFNRFCLFIIWFLTVIVRACVCDVYIRLYILHCTVRCTYSIVISIVWSGLRPCTPHITLFTLIIESQSKYLYFFIVCFSFENETTAEHLTVFPLASTELIGWANEHRATVINVRITID